MKVLLNSSNNYIIGKDNNLRKNDNSYRLNNSISFTGATNLAKEATKSQFFNSVEKKLKIVTGFVKDKYGILTDGIAKNLAKLLETNFAEKHIKNANSASIVKHLASTTSFIVSGMYIQQTLTNHKLDKKRRNTLAINQAATTIVSTVLGYVLDSFIDKRLANVKNKFVAINMVDGKLTKYAKGFNEAKSLIVFGAMYRFVAPVLITPIANILGNKVNEKDKAPIINKKNKI